MVVLSISSPLHSVTRTPLSKPFHHSFKPQLLFASHSHSLSLKTSLNPSCRASFSDGIFELPQLNGSSIQVVASQAQTDPRSGSGDSMGFLLSERTVFLSGEIDDSAADAIISQLLLLDAQDPVKDIRLFVNSYGGSMSATLAIYDVLQLVRADVSTVGLGMVASTAAIILGGGSKGKRLTMPNTRIMIHQPLGGASGQTMQVEIQARELQNSKDNAIRIISEFTGRPFDEVKDFIDVDRYMSATEAMEYGIVDGIIDEERIVPLEPIPEKVTASLHFKTISEDMEKFLSPDIPDDEMYWDGKFDAGHQETTVGR